ncbi:MULTISPECIES: hypothetical protein [Rhodococcus]|jgi:hypothetical protein|uniref:Uncharacterized protein n=1 Tax=Rhodococcus cercidiphylli TaxID=489916 RepID=A0ABU4B4M7_9NOCA|nr:MULTISPECIES: hypothetical protein [Rhodococcus]MDV6233441.1 hypothetical protein [Rhodococcus cercidiphylli]MDV7988448.1 hypothetical protein [Rhodococcus sp. IEGM 1374]
MSSGEERHISHHRDLYLLESVGQDFSLARQVVAPFTARLVRLFDADRWRSEQPGHRTTVCSPAPTLSGTNATDEWMRRRPRKWLSPLMITVI